MEAAFDTLTYFKKLTGAGFTEAQANIQTQALREVVDRTEKNLVTKANLKRDLKELEYRIIIRLGGIVVATVGISTALVLGFLPLILNQ